MTIEWQRQPEWELMEKGELHLALLCSIFYSDLL